MKRGSFIFDGVESESLHALIQGRPVIEAPLRKVEWRSTYGVDGDVPFDEGAYSNTSLPLIMLTDGENAIKDRDALYHLIDSRGTYKDFIPYFDPDKIYRVMLNEVAKFENQYYFGETQSISANFSVKPYKYLIESPKQTITQKTASFDNPTNYTSQPLITIKGRGAVTLKVNGISFHINDLPNKLSLDSERFLAYQESENGILIPMNHKVSSKDYPVFKPGINTVELVGDTDEMYVEAKWRSLV